MEKITYTSPKKDKEKEEVKSKGKPEMKTKEEFNIMVVRQALEALNTGNVSKAHEFISPQYFNHESQIDPVRAQLRGPEEFIDTIKK